MAKPAVSKPSPQTKPATDATQQHQTTSKFYNPTVIAILALVIRFGFLALNEMFDITTDVDYHVYTEAAQELLKEGGNPYFRFTYRYTPILAYMMLPNLHLAYFGKILFNLFDIAAIFYMNRYLKRLTTVSESTRYKALSFWALNPFMAYINGRGSCESIALFLLAYTLYHLKLAADNKSVLLNTTLAAVAYGLLVHFRLYPIIFCFSLYLYVNRNQILPKVPVLVFSIVSAGLNVGLIAFFYQLFGQIFLEECFLYHLRRKDPRHNYSIFWTQTVKDYFVPQTEADFPALGKILLAVRLGTIIFTAFWQRKNLVFALFLQTLVFTTLNTVYTAQYAIWEIQLLPYLLVDSSLFEKGKKAVFWSLIGIWFVFMEVWAVCSSKFEHGGKDTQQAMHFTNLVYFLIRTVFMWFVSSNQLHKVAF